MECKTNLYIIRHGESIGNINGKFNGSNNLPLSEKGINQAKSLNKFIKSIDYNIVYSSPLNRAYDTAKYSINNEKVEINVLDDLREINGGDWEGSNWVDLPIVWPKIYDDWINNPANLQMPNGDSMVGFSKRCIKVFNDIISKNRNKIILVYAHGAVIKVMQTYFSYKDLNEMKNNMWHENTGVMKIEIVNNKYNVIFENNLTHLDSTIRSVRNRKWHKKLDKYNK